MSSDESLFGDDETTPTPSSPPAQINPTQQGIAEWQVAQIRQALSRLGLEDMAQRQQTIESFVGRSVEHIRDLRFSEAQALLEHLSKREPSAITGGSAWDDREEDTWIDRL